MSDGTGMPPPEGTGKAGWYADPHQPAMERYWDGKAWSQYTAPKKAAVEGAAPPAPLAPRPPIPEPAPPVHWMLQPMTQPHRMTSRQGRGMVIRLVIVLVILAPFSWQFFFRQLRTHKTRVVDPSSYVIAITRCNWDYGFVRVTGTITNRRTEQRSYSVEVEVRAPNDRWVETLPIDAPVVDPGADRQFTALSLNDIHRDEHPTCRIIRVLLT